MSVSTEIGLHVLAEICVFSITLDGPQGHLGRCWVIIW